MSFISSGGTNVSRSLYNHSAFCEDHFGKAARYSMLSSFIFHLGYSNFFHRILSLVSSIFTITGIQQMWSSGRNGMALSNADGRLGYYYHYDADKEVRRARGRVHVVDASARLSLTLKDLSIR